MENLEFLARQDFVQGSVARLRTSEIELQSTPLSPFHKSTDLEKQCLHPECWYGMPVQFQLRVPAFFVMLAISHHGYKAIS